MRELGLDHAKVNVNGGAIALGHPLGMSGARLVVSLLHELRRRGGRYGLATLCVGVGQGQAALFERCALSAGKVPASRSGREQLASSYVRAGFCASGRAARTHAGPAPQRFALAPALDAVEPTGYPTGGGCR